jgi:tetratricopeptide (TPR) repeat protein
MRIPRAWTLAIALVGGATTAGAAAAPPAAPIAPPAGPVTFEAVWAMQVKAEKAGDTVAAVRALQDIRRLRVERNVDTVETVGLGMVLRGLERLDKGDREGAEETFRSSVALAPGLPDAHFALARALLRRWPLGVPASISATLGGATAFLKTGQGAVRLEALATIGWLLFAFTVCWAVAIALLLRKGGLLRHDLEEWLGPARRRSAVALLLAVLLLPVASFLGWGWLPLWWVALLFAYLDRAEKAVAVALALAAVTVGPSVSSLDTRLRTANNALYSASLAAVEGVPDRGELKHLERAARADPQDRDLGYLLGVGLKRAGYYEEAAEHYRRLLAADPTDAFARNNLAGIEFARGAYDAALLRYKEGVGSENADVAATSHYNQSIAHLQKFEYQAFNEAKSNADRLARGLVAEYEGWKYDTGDYAVVDLRMTREQVRTKFEGVPDGVALRNVVRGGERPRSRSSVASSLLNRFTASIALMALVVFVVGRWRGSKAFTLHCGRCGTAFCRYCHLGRVAGGLCSQCYHLFVVRDGVSGPARNRKLSEVQQAESRRERVFRVLSVLSPGAGHVYTGRPLVGLALTTVWYALLALLVAPAVVPFAGVSSRIAPSWPSWAVAVLLLAVWLAANRLRSELEVALPARRPGPRRAKVA